MFNREAIFLKGHSHTVCEDYAQDTSINVGGEIIPAIVVSDGCSSERNTDMGSRFLTYAAFQVLKEVWGQDYTHKQLGEEIILRAEMFSGMMGTGPNVNYATLILAYIKGDKACVHMWGDGTIIFNGQPLTVSYSNNAPYYLKYKSSPYLNQQFWAEPQTVILEESNEILDPENLYWEWNVADMEHLILSTDGISSFLNQNGEMTVSEIANELTAFKNTNRGFLARRLQKLFKTFESKYEIFEHYDDLGIAALIKE